MLKSIGKIDVMWQSCGSSGKMIKLYHDLALMIEKSPAKSLGFLLGCVWSLWLWIDSESKPELMTGRLERTHQYHWAAVIITFSPISSRRNHYVPAFFFPFSLSMVPWTATVLFSRKHKLRYLNPRSKCVKDFSSASVLSETSGASSSMLSYLSE